MLNSTTAMKRTFNGLVGHAEARVFSLFVGEEQDLNFAFSRGDRKWSFLQLSAVRKQDLVQFLTVENLKIK